MKNAIFILVFALAASLVNAQIVITMEDVNNQFQVGNTSVEHIDTLTKMIDIGTVSTDNYWDFSDDGLTAHITYSETVYDASDSPYYSNFLSADKAVKVVEENLEDQGVLWMHYGYYNDALVNYGYGVTAQLRVGSADAVVKNDPGEDEMIFPFTVGTYWTYSGTEVTTFYTPFGEYSEEIQIDITCTVDAAGMMKLPNGQEIEALRIHEIRHYVAEELDGNVEYTEVLYTFVSKYGHEVSVSTTQDQPNEGSVLANGVLWCDEWYVDVEDETASESPVQFGLKQNYPNPFNPTTTIEYSIAKGTNVKVKVYDILGNEVATLVNGFKPAGNYKETFNAYNLPSGNYFVRLQAGEAVDVKKITLLK